LSYQIQIGLVRVLHFSPFFDFTLKTGPKHLELECLNPAGHRAQEAWKLFAQASQNATQPAWANASHNDAFCIAILYSKIYDAFPQEFA
jgi:hypothetical protein